MHKFLRVDERIFLLNELQSEKYRRQADRIRVILFLDNEQYKAKKCSLSPSEISKYIKKNLQSNIKIISITFLKLEVTRIALTTLD